MAVNLWAPSEQNKKDVLVEFRAGKMNYSPTTKMVEADKRKGLVQLKQSPEDSLIHFIWKDRTTGTEVMNLTIIPGEAAFRKVEEAKGRVYVLEWKTADKKLFFWIQEPKDDKDKENCENITKFINEPPQPANQNTASGLGGLGSALNGMDQAQLRQLLQAGGFGGMEPSQLMQMLAQGGEGPGWGAGRRGPQARTQPRPTALSTTQSAATPPAHAPASINRVTLQSILDGLLVQPQPQPQPQPQSSTSEQGKDDKKDQTQGKSEEKKEDQKDETKDETKDEIIMDEIIDETKGETKDEKKKMTVIRMRISRCIK